MAGVESPWYDEVITLKHLDAESLSAFLGRVSEANSPTQPLYFLLEYGWAQLFGSDYRPQRWLSIILSEISLVLVYLIGHRLQGMTTGFLAALALASSAMHIEYSLEIRMYMLAFVWAMLSVYSLLRLLSNGGKVWWSVNFGSTVGLVWTHAFGVFLLPVEAIACLFLGTRSLSWQARWFGGQIIAAGTLGVWLLQANGEKVSKAMDWLPNPTIWFNDGSNYVSLFGTWYAWMVPLEYHTKEWGFRSAVPLVIYGGLALAALVYSLVKLQKKDQDEEFSYGVILWMTTWWFIPSIFLYGLSHILQPAFFPRYVLYSMAAPFLMGSWMVSQISSVRWKGSWIGILIVLALAMGYSNTRQVYRAPWDWLLAETDKQGAAKLMLFSQYSEGNLMRKSVIQYLRPGNDREVLTLTDSNGLVEYITAHDYVIPCFVVLLDSQPQATMGEFLLSVGLTADVIHYPARRQMTLYTIRR